VPFNYEALDFIKFKLFKCCLSIEKREKAAKNEKKFRKAKGKMAKELDLVFIVKKIRQFRILSRIYF